MSTASPLRPITEHRQLWWLLGLTLLGHALMGIGTPLNGDEALYWEWSRHLDWGYYTHPPITGWLIALFTWPLGSSVLTVRLPSVLMHLGTTALVYRMAWEWAPRRRLALTAGVLYALTPLSLVLGTVMTTDCALIFFWTLALYFTKRAVLDDEARAWYAAGLAAGAMLLAKFFAVLFFPALLAFLLLHPAYRRVLLRKEPWLAVLLALLVWSPFLVWNATHNWLTFRFNLVNRQTAAGLDLLQPLRFVAGQLLAASPVLLVVLVAALGSATWWGLRRVRRRLAAPVATAAGAPEARFEDSTLFYAAMAGVPLLIFLWVSLTSKVGAHWTAALYPAWTLLAAGWLERSFGGRDAQGEPLAPAGAHGDDADIEGNSLHPRPPRRRWGWVTLAGLLLTTLPLAALVLQPKLMTLSAAGARYYYADPTGEANTLGEHYFGWAAGGQRIAELQAEWEAKPEGFFLATQDYSDAALWGMHTPGHPQFTLIGYPAREFHGKEFLIWGRALKRKGANALFVMDSPILRYAGERLLPYCGEVRELEPLDINDDEGRLLRRIYFALCLNYLANEPERVALP